MWDIKNKFAINFKIIGMLTILEKKGGSYENNYSFFILIYFIFLGID